MENELKPSYQLIETNIKTGEKSLCKNFYSYAEAKKHLKGFYEFLIDDKIQTIDFLKVEYLEAGYTYREITNAINTDIQLPLLHNRNTVLLDDYYKYEIKKIN